MYIGGAEHAVLHLLYVRFVALALHDMGILDFSAKGGSASGGDEPMKKFRAHGLLIKDGAKMSMSKGNVVNPDEYIKNFGADALRTYLMFLAPFEQGGDFRDQSILGITRFLDRVWKMAQGKWQVADSKSERLVHQTVKKVTEDVETLNYNTAVSTLMICLNAFEEGGVARTQYSTFLKLLAPFAPHMTEEIWQDLARGKGQRVKGKFRSIHQEKWPKYDPKLLVADTFTLVIQVNGKTRDSVVVPADISENEARELALTREKVKPFVGSQPPKRHIYVPQRLINIVV
jgi:leucyl-tRNA synthetase